MSRVHLVAETGADIPPELAERYGISLVPMHVSFGSVSREDGTFPSEEICAYYERIGILPQTSASMPEDFLRVFDHIRASQPEAQILHLGYSAVTTCSFQSAQLAAAGRDDVTSLDTKMASAGQHAIVIKTAQLLEANGLDLEELWLIWAPGLRNEIRQAAEQAARSCGVRQVHWVKTGGVITCHGGPGAFGVVGFTA